MQVHNKKSLKEIRRTLRKDATPAEDILWQHLRSGKLDGLKFKRQHSIGNYIVDFYCSSCKLVIELDGEVHSYSEQKEKDLLRDINLREMGFKILRFKNEDVLFRIDETISEILKNAYRKPE